MRITKIEFDDPWELLDSGSLIHYDNEKPMTLKVIESDGTPINVRFVLLKDIDIKQSVIKLENFDKDTIQIAITHNGHLSNFGYLTPIKLGAYNGKKLFFNFRLDLNNIDDSTLFHFSWYLSGEDNV